MPDDHAALEAIFDEHGDVLSATRSRCLADVALLAGHLSSALETGGKLLVFGNGGSAADAQHFAAELVGRFRRVRRPLPALALTVDSSTLTAIANDFSYDEVFERQVLALAGPADVVVGISTGGGAVSVANGLRAAGERGATTWALTGAAGGRVAEAAAHAVRVPSDVTARVQEMHVTVIHAISELVDARAAARDATSRTPEGTGQDRAG